MARRRLSALKRLPSLLGETRTALGAFENGFLLALVYGGFKPVALGDTFRLRGSQRALVVSSLTDVKTLWGIHCRQEYEVRPDDTCIIDIGAHVGYFALYAAVRAPRAKIYSYEPIQENYDRLCQQVGREALGERISCFNRGVAGTSGRRLIFLDRESVNCSLLPISPSRRIGERSIEVVTLETVLSGMTEPLVSLLKVDCEGAEWEIFEASETETLRRIKRICVEWHAPEGRSADDLEQLLRKRGFVRYGQARTAMFSRIMWFINQR